MVAETAEACIIKIRGDRGNSEYPVLTGKSSFINHCAGSEEDGLNNLFYVSVRPWRLIDGYVMEDAILCDESFQQLVIKMVALVVYPDRRNG